MDPEGNLLLNNVNFDFAQWQARVFFGQKMDINMRGTVEQDNHTYRLGDNLWQ